MRLRSRYAASCCFEGVELWCSGLGVTSCRCKEANVSWNRWAWLNRSKRGWCCSGYTCRLVVSALYREENLRPNLPAQIIHAQWAEELVEAQMRPHVPTRAAQTASEQLGQSEGNTPTSEHNAGGDPHAYVLPPNRSNVSAAPTA